MTKAAAAKPKALNDGLTNVATGIGSGRDPSTSNRWSLFTGGVLSVITPDQIDAAYRTSWLVRKVHDIPPEEMVKAWRLWSLKAKEITKIEAEEKRLKVREVFLQALRLARLRGGAAIVMGLGGDPSKAAPTVVPKGGLQYLFPVSRDQLTVQSFDRDVASPFFGQPKAFQLNARVADNDAIIHPSRVIVFKGLPAPDVFVNDDAMHFWGLPLMESINDALQDATVVQRAIAALVPEANVDVIKVPGLTNMVSTKAGEASLANRLMAAQTFKSLLHAVILDNGTEGVASSGEEWETKTVSFAHLAEVGRFMLQVAAGAADIPVTRLIGAPPQGMNATGEGDEENFLKMIRSKQGMDLRPALERLDPYILGSADVSATEGATWDFAPLEVMSPQEQADLDNVTADTFVILKEGGLFSPEALAKVATAVFDERDTFPGFAEAVTAHPDIPAVAEAEMATKTAEAALQAPKVTGMVPNKVTPKSGAGGAMGRVRKAANDGVEIVLRAHTLDEIRDAEPMTLYVSRKVMNPQEILNHFRAQGVDGLVAAGDLHVTVIHSKTPVDWMKLPGDWSGGRDGKLLIPPGGPRLLELFGPETDTLVQSFASSELGWRNTALLEAGCSSDWDDYAPHITIVSEVGPDFDLSALKPYTGRIVLGPEIFEEVRVKAPEDDAELIEAEM